MQQKQPFPTLLSTWIAYWFRPAPLFNLAVCRVLAVGFQLIYLMRRDYLSQLFEVSALPNSSYDPLLALKFIIFPLGLEYCPPLSLSAGIFWLTIAAGILSLVGLRTRISLLIFAIGNLFIQTYLYSYGDYHHPEGLMLIALFLLALSPASKVLSVDDLRYRLRRNIQQKQFVPFDLLSSSSQFSRWPLLLIQWMFALIYFSAALSKLSPAGPGLGTWKLDWMNGYTLQYYLIRDALRWNSELGLWFGQHHNLVIVASIVAIAYEATFFLVLIFPRLAWLYIPVGTSFHIGIYMMQRAPFFQFITLYAVFVPWTIAIKRISKRQRYGSNVDKPEILYDGLCPLCIRSMTVLCYFDWLKQIEYSDLELQWGRLSAKHPELSLEDCRREMHLLLPDGNIEKGFFAFRRILHYLPPFWILLPLLYFPGVSLVGPKVYQFIASRRSRFERCTFDQCSI